MSPFAGQACTSLVRWRRWFDTAFPVATHRVLEADISCAMNPQDQGGMQSDGGAFAAVLDPDGPITGRVLLEQSLIATWDPYTYRNARTGLTFAISTVDPTAVGNYITISCLGWIDTIDETLVEGSMFWDIGFIGGYPEDSGDGGGLKPADVLTVVYGTEAGP